MRITLFLICVGFLLSCSTPQFPRVENVKSVSREIPFDNNWMFSRDSLSNVEIPDYDDLDWRMLDLPHDWSIEDIPDSGDVEIFGPFSKASPGGPSTGHVVGGTAWYRKHFILKTGDDNIVTLHFDGVYMDSDVWLNGKHLGRHPYGYTPFAFELTPYLRPAGEENILAVRVKNLGKNSRWYSGSGIYRHVWLTVTEKLFVEKWGVGITTPEVSKEQATVNISVSAGNRTGKETKTGVRVDLLDPLGHNIGQEKFEVEIAADSVHKVRLSIPVKNPQLWTLDSPALYNAVVKIDVAGKVVDKCTTAFGIRSIKFDPETGFTLNGESVLLRGGCMHHDNGPLGSATIDRAEERRVELMKKFGFNAIRTSHNPPSKQFLDACDRLGVLVIDEAFDMWERPKNPQDYHLFFKQWWKHDLAAMVMRDRNHPCVILWSIGNEINERADPSGLALTREMVDFVHDLDSSRPVTAAICDFWDHPGREWNRTAPAFAMLDVGGYNYQWKKYESDLKKYPHRLIIGTESVPLESWENWEMVKRIPQVIGDFVWTAMDYFGEAGIGNSIIYEDSAKVKFWRDWPWYNAYCGDIGVCGFKKPQSYLRDVVWGLSKLEMAVHVPMQDGYSEKVSYWGWPDERQSWTWPGHEGEALQVSVYTSCQTVALLLNGEKIDEKSVPPDSGLKVRFHVPYAPGELKAVGLTDGKETASKIFTTTGEAKKIFLSADRQEIFKSRNDLAYITVEVLDDQGRRVPDAEMQLHFKISGAGELVAVGNGNPADMKSFQQPECKTFRGRCLVILRPNGKGGKIRLKAEGDGLEPAQIVVKTH
ncbi:DUF4982 domain-containing protein [candidate division KSB1 bacterium]|nr:DUF4982 domain-containing protein [candidate division KSB1 bacterium]